MGIIPWDHIPPPIDLHNPPLFTTILCVLLSKTKFFPLSRYQEKGFFTIYIFQIKKEGIVKGGGSERSELIIVYSSTKCIFNDPSLRPLMDHNIPPSDRHVVYGGNMWEYTRWGVISYRRYCFIPHEV